MKEFWQKLSLRAKVIGFLVVTLAVAIVVTVYLGDQRSMVQNLTKVIRMGRILYDRQTSAIEKAGKIESEGIESSAAMALEEMQRNESSFKEKIEANDKQVDEKAEELSSHPVDELAHLMSLKFGLREV